MPRQPVYPKGLEIRGKRLWRDVAAARPRLGAGERVLLEEACRMADRLERLNEQIVGASLPYEVDGQDRVVLVTDAAQQEARLALIALRQVLMSLGLDKMAQPVPAPAPAPQPPPPPARAPADPLDEIKEARERRERGTA